MGGIISNFQLIRRRSTTKHIHVKPAHSSLYSYGDQIDVDILFSALLKLSCVFEVKESLTTSLIDAIIDPAHNSFDDQFVAVEQWINKHGSRNGIESELTTDEIDYLIQYVELYQPLPMDNDDDDEKDQSIVKTLSASESERIATFARKCPLLVCPYRSDLAYFTGEIRNQEAKRLNSSAWNSIPAADNTVNILFGSMSTSMSTSERQLLPSEEQGAGAGAGAGGEQCEGEGKREGDCNCDNDMDVGVGTEVENRKIRNLMMGIDEDDNNNNGDDNDGMPLVRCDSMQLYVRGFSEDDQEKEEVLDF